MARKELRIRAASLRRRGYLYTEIAVRLGVAKSTAYEWTSKLELSPQERDLIKIRLADSKRALVEKLAASKRKRREIRDMGIAKEARAILSRAKLTVDHKKVQCALLFWCEGGKDVAAGIQFINSDPGMV